MANRGVSGRNSGDTFANLPPGPKYIKASVWKFILKKVGGDTAAAIAAVRAAQTQFAKELGVMDDPESVWANTHNGGQFITSRWGVPGNSLTEWGNVNYGQRPDGSYRTKEESDARKAADKHARETMTVLEYEEWKLAGN